MQGRSLLLWVGRHPGQPVRLCCEEPSLARAARDEELVAVAGCLADLPDAFIFELVALGCPRVALDVAACPHERAASWAARILDIARATGCADRVVEAGDGRKASPHRAEAMPTLRRRALLGLSGGAGEVDLPPEAATPHARLRTAIRAIGHRVEEPVAAAPGAALDLTSRGCTACGVCPKACPEQALALQERPDELRFDASRCTGCGRCLEVCDPRALSADERLGWDSLFDAPTVLERLETVRCTRCKDTFVATDGATLCPSCAFRVANPFGMMIPPGAQRILDERTRPRA